MALRDDQLHVVSAAELQHPGSARVELTLDKRDAKLVRAVQGHKRIGESIRSLAFPAVDD